VSVRQPGARQDDEAFGLIGTLDDLNGPFADLVQRLPELVSGIGAIGKDMAQPREALDDLGQHQRRAVAVLNVDSVDYAMDQIAIGVGQDVALAAVDLLACILAPRPGRFLAFHALVADHPGTGRGVAPCRLAPDQQQGKVQ
jgi:hypothetical protein